MTTQAKKKFKCHSSLDMFDTRAARAAATKINAICFIFVGDLVPNRRTHAKIDFVTVVVVGMSGLHESI